MEAGLATPLRLSVSIVLHHSPVERLAATVESLGLAAQAASEAGLLSAVELTLLDNSCDPRYREGIRRALLSAGSDRGCRIDYIQLDGNRGFGAAHNRVLDALESDVHLVLNPDVELDAQALVAGLTRLRRESGIVLVSPRATGGDGRQEFLCKRYPSVLVLLLRAFVPRFLQAPFRDRLDHYEMVDLCRGGEPVDVTLASGCFMLVPTRVLRAVGGFDERYFLYFEDFDLSLRLADQGRLVFDPAVRIVHHGGYAARKGLRHVAYFMRSGVRFFRDHGWCWI